MSIISLWRALSNCIAVRANLMCRMPNMNSICLMCNQEEETAVHLLTNCPTAKQESYYMVSVTVSVPIIGSVVIVDVWYESKFSLRSNLLPQNSLVDWWNALTSDLIQLGRTREDVASCAFILWNIWKARNDVVFNQNHLLASEIVDKAYNQQREYTNALKKRHNLDAMPSSVTTARTILSLWLPPPTGFHKVNFDGAIDMNSKIGAIGFVVSDCAGNIILAGARRFPGIVVPITIEALALRTSMEEVLLPGYKDIICEGDCQILINAVNSSSSDDRDAGVVLEDILSLIFHFSEIRFSYVNRENNWVAHMVARKALVDDCFCSTHHSVTNWLTQMC
ncbi:uncharacterized protein LOC126665213 [Mercurialis annua]|uniref:uncharacterized protein LOC126665213 n=1 Tax=Mercurialis annua TaxID=3986 RepID=UPI0021601C80|nr:uncharacterized protein LOC126665213 [Mercurialis annua]